MYLNPFSINTSIIMCSETTETFNKSKHLSGR